MQLVKQLKAVPKNHFVVFVTFAENNIPFLKSILRFFKYWPQSQSPMKSARTSDSFSRLSLSGTGPSWSTSNQERNPLQFQNLSKLQLHNFHSKYAARHSPENWYEKCMNKFIQDNILQTKYYPPRFFIQFSVKAVLDRTLCKHWCHESNFKRATESFFKKKL